MKFQRQAKILELIDTHEVETQEELSALLCKLGYVTTQATVSRDIKELRLVKVLAASGKYKYATSSKDAEGEFAGRLKNIFWECVTSLDHAQNIVVIKTLPALGSAAASAIDSLRIADIVGTLAGDDTVFVVMRNAESAENFTKTASGLIK